MKTVKMTIKEIEAHLNRGQVTREWVAQLASDPRQGVKRLVKRWQQQQERERESRERWEAMSRFEHFYRERGLVPIAGVDEAGRGPLAGPVVAAAVILPEMCYIRGLNDSKKLQAAEREYVYEEIDRQAVDWTVAVVPAHRIDEINIYHASLEAMSSAVKQLRPSPSVLLNDAFLLPDIEIVQEKIIRGDGQSVSIAAASIMAKVTRDRLMVELDAEYPEYGFAQHKGYATAEHLDALKRHGLTPEHRRSFAPVKDVMSAL